MSAPTSTEPTEAEILAQMEVLEGQLIRLRDTLAADIEANQPQVRRRARRGDPR